MTACDLLLNLPFLLKVIDGAVNGTGKLVCMRGQYMQEFNTEVFSSSSFISVYIPYYFSVNISEILHSELVKV